MEKYLKAVFVIGVTASMMVVSAVISVTMWQTRTVKVQAMMQVQERAKEQAATVFRMVGELRGLKNDKVDEVLSGYGVPSVMPSAQGG